MNKRITIDDIHNAIERQLSDLNPDPWLAQHIIASDKEEVGVKKKLSISLVCAIAVAILTTAACAVTALHRVITWQGEVSRTVDPTEMPDSQYTDVQEFDYELLYFLLEVPDSETVYAWFNGDNGTIQYSRLHNMQRVFITVEEFIQYMSDIQQLTLPQWFPNQNIKFSSAKIYLECKAFGNYELLETGQSGDIHYKRFQIDDSSAIATGYQLVIVLEDGSSYSIISELRQQTAEEPIRLREGENARRVTIEGMSDALLITAEDPAYPDGLIMQRKFSDPVRLKLLPYNDKMEESDDRCYQYEYVTVWVYNQDDPEEMLNKLFPFV